MYPMYPLLLLVTLLLSAFPAWASPLTWTFTGAQGYDGGTVSGTLTYEATEAPSQTDVHGVTGNTVYQLHAWDFVAQPIFGGAYLGASSLNGSPSTMEWANTLPGSGSEFCLGNCIFSTQFYDRLYFTNGFQTLQLLWLPTTTGLPQSEHDWGTFAAWSPATGGGTWLRSNSQDGTLQVLAMLTAGQLTRNDPVSQAVPEPSTIFYLLAAGLAGWVGRGWMKLWRSLCVR